MTGLAYRVVVAGFLTLVLFGLASHVELLWSGSFRPVALPICLSIAAWIAAGAEVPTPRDPRPIPLRWVVPAVLVLAVVTVAITYGAIATPARHWDGTVAWDLKAEYLTRTPSLLQDYFTEPGVFCHSRDYPLLQPVTIAAGSRLLGDGVGRGLFGVLYVLLVMTVGVVVRARASRGWLGLATAVAVGVTPALVNPSMGGADSGFGELALATSVTGMAAGISLRSPLLLGAALFSSILFKPEALLYGAIPVALCWCTAERALLRSALLAWLGAAALWLPLQHEIQHFWQGPTEHVFVWGALAALGIVVAGSDSWLHRRAVSIRTRVLLAIVAAPLAMAALPLLAFVLSDASGTANVYLQDLARPLERVPRLPRIVWGMIDHAWLRLDFALAFVIPLAVVLPVERRSPTKGERAIRLTNWFLVLGLASVLLPFLLSPEDDLRHHLRSSMTRLLIHWIGALWIVNGLGIDRAWTADTLEQPSPEATA